MEPSGQVSMKIIKSKEDEEEKEIRLINRFYYQKQVFSELVMHLLSGFF
jgi:plasmid replication initiation protein